MLALSLREKQVQALVVDGMSNAEVAEQLGISIRTVETHVHNLLNKTGAQNRIQLAHDRTKELYMKTYLVTGGSGSFGRAFVREALKHDVKAVRIYSRGEYLQWQMQQELRDERLRYMLGDIRDRERLRACMHGVDVVIHAAALKHVSTGEYNPQEMMRTNVDGSTNVVEIAVQCGVSKVLGISSDKAVNPANLYGTTKQLMEQLFIHANTWAWPGSKLAILRSGNFRDSHGNVFEAWKQQALTGTIELTSEAMRRYYINSADVAKIAWNVIAEMDGREIFVPKMEELWMANLARDRYPHCQIRITGKGEGEKDREQLWREDERVKDLGDYYLIRR